ncbi:hypothetical protein WSM22_16250 [Cytophagales bacterium WSM2-2]|nr:hypothetical protein WSM22_16250 [Cytophagales bacterium WSM2-2]
MKKFSSIIFLVTLTSVCFSQVADNFADGDFTSNPSWAGAASAFTINSSKQLQLNSTTAGQSYLSVPFAANSLNDYEWQILVKQSFAPSSTNYGRIYLTSDKADLSQALNGYYLQFGEALSNDAIELFRQTGATSTSICRGKAAGVASSFTVRVKVTRDVAGLWKVFVDYTGGTNLILDASGTDLTYKAASFFGVRCTYTASNANKFFFDDIYAGPTQTDKTPPTILSTQVTSINSVSVLFSEAVEKASSETLANYSADNSFGNPTSAVLQPDKKTVVLTFMKNFGNGITNQLTVVGIKDFAGNVMAPSSTSFLFFKAVPAYRKDILLTEVFPDPSPQIGLPTQEYVEIYNRSSSPFDLAGWKFSDGSSVVTFGSQIILPQQYWIITASANANLFTGFGHVSGVTNFPTLNNGSDNLTLRDASGKTIDSVSYASDWYHDNDKLEGGWSIEIIDINNDCGEGDNWAASEDISGGTPGKQNSVFANKPDVIGPQLLSVNAISPTRLELIFNEKLEKDLASVSIDLLPSITIIQKHFTDPSLRQIIIDFSSELLLRQLYTISVSNLADCAGNFIQADFNRLSFALPEAADSLDILVNEVLFNPRSGGVDFVEVYNNSLKYINLKNWKLANYQGDSIAKAVTLSSVDFIFKPSSFIVFTSDPDALVLQYPQTILTSIFKTSLPSLPDDEGSIALVTDQNQIIDNFSYSEKMHSSLVKDNEGVSLERISLVESTRNPGNWRSANASAGFATPGFMNSNSRPESFFSENSIIVDPEVFSPSVPGSDFSKINYKFDQSGMGANVKILDSQGRLIKTLANNETLAQEGFFRWDGDRDDGTRSRTGYYVVWFEVFDPAGTTQVFRKRAVIGK